MNRRRAQHSVVVLLMTAGAAMAQTPGSLPAKSSHDRLILSSARVLDPTGGRLLDARTITIRNGRILEVGPAKPVPAAGPDTQAESLDLAGLTVLPGLIDLHTHLLLHPYNEAPWSDQVLRESPELRTIRAVVAARATLEAGFTTIRDLGTEGAGLADVALRDAISQGMIPGPRLIAVTRAIVATGCYGPQDFERRLDLPQGADEATGVDEVRRVVRRQITQGADWIKFYADYHRRAGAPATASFSQAEMDAIVDEARSAGLPVAAHATTPEGIRRAVLAGVRTIEHGYEASDDALKLMRDRGVYFCPTLAAAEAYDLYEIEVKKQTGYTRLEPARKTVARAIKLGVKIACGSDAGVFPHGENVRELELLVDCGMSPAQALRAATVTAAEALTREGELGRVQPGYIADLIAVRGDPLGDIRALRSPVLVIHGGRIVVDHLHQRRKKS